MRRPARRIFCSFWRGYVLLHLINFHQFSDCSGLVSFESFGQAGLEVSFEKLFTRAVEEADSAIDLLNDIRAVSGFVNHGDDFCGTADGHVSDFAGFIVWFAVFLHRFLVSGWVSTL